MKMLIALLLVPIGAMAQSESATRQLLNQPTSLLDVGMVRLQMLTGEFERRVGLSWTTSDGKRERFKAKANSYFDTDADRIYVSFTIMNSEATYPQMEEGCRTAMGQMGVWLMKSLPELFSHVGSDRTEKAKLFDALREMVVLRCYVSSGGDTSEGRFWGSQTLKDWTMSIGRWH